MMSECVRDVCSRGTFVPRRAGRCISNECQSIREDDEVEAQPDIVLRPTKGHFDTSPCVILKEG